MKQNKKGFVSIEAIISMATFLIMFVMCIGFYVYTMPKLTLEKEVHLLAQKAKIQGGLTYEDVDIFKENLKLKGYNPDEITVNAVTVKGSGGAVGGASAIGVDGINVDNATNYIKRSEVTPIEISVSVPANTKLLKGPLSHMLSTKALNDKYYFRETVLSERW